MGLNRFGYTNHKTGYMKIVDVHSKLWSFDRSKLIGLFYNCKEPTNWVILELKAAKIKVYRSELENIMQ